MIERKRGRPSPSKQKRWDAREKPMCEHEWVLVTSDFLRRVSLSCSRCKKCGEVEWYA